MARQWINAGVVLGVTALVALSSSQRTPTLVSEARAGDPVAELERTVAHAPADGEAVRSLIKVYLERDAPGLAVTVASRSPGAAMATPASADLTARAYLGAGRATESLGVTRQVLARCEAQEPCEASLVARATRREQLLEAMVELGVEDADKNPEVVQLAYRKTARNVRVALK